MSNRPRRGALFARSRRGSHFAYILLEFALQKVAPRVTTSLVGTWTAAKMPEKEKSERRLFLRPSQAASAAPRMGAPRRRLESAEWTRMAPARHVARRARRGESAGVTSREAFSR